MQETKDYALINDKVIKKIFNNYNSGKKYSARIISQVLNIPEEDILNSMEVIHPRIGLNKNLVDSEADTVYEADKRIISIEYNMIDSDRTVIKNGSYICELYIKQLPNSKEYTHIKPITQISIDNYDYFNEDRFLYHSMLMEESLHLVDSNLVEIYHINLPKLRKIDYNEMEDASELEKILYLFVCDDREKLNELYEGDELMSEVMKDADKIIETLDSLLYYNSDRLNKLSREDAINEGRAEGHAEGRAEQQLEIAKKMLQDKMHLDIISKYTGLSQEEILNLKEED